MQEDNIVPYVRWTDPDPSLDDPYRLSYYAL